MKTREEVAKYINSGRCSDDADKRCKYNQYHFGLNEVKCLMDFIYGGEPKDESEHILPLIFIGK